VVTLAPRLNPSAPSMTRVACAVHRPGCATTRPGPTQRAPDRLAQLVGSGGAAAHRGGKAMLNANVIGKRVSAERFDRGLCANIISLMADLSELGADGAAIFGQLYADAADVGFVLHSERTGVEVPFYLEREEKWDGEVLAWHFRATDDAKRRWPSLGQLV